MKYRKGQRVRVKIPVWLANRNNLVSTEFEGKIEIVTPRAVYIEGKALIRKSHYCMKCGIRITNPVSILVGYGPECSKRLGIPRDFREEDVPRLIETIEATVKTWIPLSVSEIEVLEDVQSDEPEAEVHVEGDWIIVHAPYAVKDALKTIFGARWNPEKKAWTFPAEEITASRIDFILSQYTAKKDEEFTRLANAGRKEIESRQRAAELKNNENLPDVPVTRFPAWKHQKQAFWFAKDMRAAALLMDMGTGKTKVTIDLIQNRNHRSTLIICPRSVVAVWPKEFKKHLADPESIEVVALDKGSVAQKTKKAQKTMEKAEKMGKSIAVVINYESAWREPFATWAKGAGFEFVVVDESHRIKSPSGKASRFCAEIGKRVKYRLALTGTPMPHSPLDVYAQYRFLDPTIFGTNYHRFKTRYAIFDKLPNGGEIIRGYQLLDELHEKMYTIAYRVTKEDIQDILNLPDAVHVQRYCELSSKATRLYRQMEDDFYADVESGEVTATNALTRLLRLQQMTSGFVRTDEGEDVQIDTSKEELLSDILEDIDVKTPVVVFARFQHDLDTIRRVAEKQGRKYAELSGRMSTLKEWQEGQYDLIGVQLQAGGVGIDLTRANIAIYYSMGFNMGDYEQSLARIHRPGQTKKCTYIHLIAERTVDEKVYNALSQRKNVVESVLRG